MWGIFGGLFRTSDPYTVSFSYCHPIPTERGLQSVVPEAPQLDLQAVGPWVGRVQISVLGLCVVTHSR